MSSASERLVESLQQVFIHNYTELFVHFQFVFFSIEKSCRKSSCTMGGAFDRTSHTQITSEGSSKAIDIIDIRKHMNTCTCTF